MVLFCSFYHLLSNLVIFSPFCPLKFYSIHSVLFNLLRSIKSKVALFSPYWSYSVHIGPILSTLGLFGQFYLLWFYLVLFGLFCLLWFYSVHIGFLQPIMSTLVLFGPIWSHSAHFGVHSFLFSPLYSYLVPFGPLWSYLVHSVNLVPIWSYSDHFVAFDPICSIWTKFGPFCPLEFYLV